MNEGNLKINSEGTYGIVNRQITTLINNYIEINGAVETFRILKANSRELT